MTKKKWTTDEQEVWLTPHVADFIRAQQHRTTGTFFGPIYKGWLENFPCPEPTSEQIEAANGDAKKAKALIVQKAKKVSATYMCVSQNQPTNSSHGV